MIPDNKILELRGALERSGFKENGNSNELRGNCPYRHGSDSHGFLVWLPGSGSGKIGTFDHATNENGTLVTLANHYNIRDFEIATAPARATYHANPEYIYHNEQGDPVYKVIKLADKKGFPQYHMCSSGKWTIGLGGNADRCDCSKVQYSLYHLDKLMTAGPGSTVIICEGEKDVLTAESLGFVATSNSGGAGKWHYVPSHLYEYFSGKHVVVIADNDDAGDRHASDIINALRGRCLSIKSIKFNGAKGHDLTDWANDGGTAEGFQDRIDLTLDISAALANTLPPPVDQPPNMLEFPAADEGNAQSVNLLYGGQFLYTDERGWLHYTGSHWKAKGSEAELTRAIVDTLIQRRTQAVKADMEPIVKATKPTAGNVKNAKYLFQSMVWADLDSFDTEKTKLNCKNGVVDFLTGDISLHSNKQRFTYCVNTPYNKDADDSQWVRWLYSTVKPEGASDQDSKYLDLCHWLKKAVGYSITGLASEHIFFYLHGPTRSGKGVFIQSVMSVLGKPLGSNIGFETLTTSLKGADSAKRDFDLATLKAARFLGASESGVTNTFNEALMKRLAGEDAISCALKGKDRFEYMPEFKIWLSSNHPIKARAGDPAFWGRVRVIDFPNSHLDREDKSLKAKLLSKREGILKWAIEGAMIWCQATNKGDDKILEQPQIVRDAVETHREENDTIQLFMNDCCVFGDNFKVKGTLFTTAYKEWCKENSYPALGGKNIKIDMAAKGFINKTVRASPVLTFKGYEGVGLEAVS